MPSTAKSPSRCRLRLRSCSSAYSRATGFWALCMSSLLTACWLNQMIEAEATIHKENMASKNALDHPKVVCVSVFHVVVDARLIDGIDAHLSAGVQDAVVL